MERRNGGDPLAPPRPPKPIPRVHRPRAPEPPMMSENTSVTATAAAIASAVATTTAAGALPLHCDNSTRNNNNSISRHNSITEGEQHSHSINSSTALLKSSTNNNLVVISQPALQQYQHNLLATPLSLLHQQQKSRPASPPATSTSLNRNNSSVSNASSLSPTATSASSFARRRPQAPATESPLTPRATQTSSATASVPLLTVVNGNILSSSFLHQEPVPASPVTLAAPRPESERLTNEYVDTPFHPTQHLQHASRTQHPAGQNLHGQTTTQHSLLQQQSQNHQQHHHSSRVGTAGSATTSTATAATMLSARSDSTCGDHVDSFLHSSSYKTSAMMPTVSGMTATPGNPTVIDLMPPPHSTRPPAINALPNAQPIVSKQPAAAEITVASNSFMKDPRQQHPAFQDDILGLHHIGGISTPPGESSTAVGAAIGTSINIGGNDASALNPITCPRCERCRCEQCQSPRQLPQTWVCNKTCLCSAETVIDYASCLCCVKALFYHCAKDHEIDCDDGAATLCVDDPCSCLPHKRGQRWGWLGALSVVLPCLWCYWPMRGCAVICEKCYGRYASHGCRCQQIGSTSSMLPIVPLGINSSTNSGIVVNGGSSLGSAKTAGSAGSAYHHHHHHQRHHSGCSVASEILRKCDVTPEKRLLDSSPEY